MSIAKTFAALRDKKEMALVPYITGGFPSLEQSMTHLKEIAQGGADIIEVGIPFSDPVADGATIQHASQVALQQGVSLTDIIGALREVDVQQPLVVMSYLNPLMSYGKERLFADLYQAGVRGLIVPDLPLEEAEEWTELAAKDGIDVIFLVAPTSSDERIAAITQKARGFLYCVSIAGTTGARTSLPDTLPLFLERVRKHTDLPLAVGFGISRPEHVQGLYGNADGAVVGSRIIQAIQDKEDVQQVIQALKAATRSESC